MKALTKDLDGERDVMCVNGDLQHLFVACHV
jgi:hypothetical protein